MARGRIIGHTNQRRTPTSSYQARQGQKCAILAGPARSTFRADGKPWGRTTTTSTPTRVLYYLSDHLRLSAWKKGVATDHGGIDIGSNSQRVRPLRKPRTSQGEDLQMGPLAKWSTYLRYKRSRLLAWPWRPTKGCGGTIVVYDHWMGHGHEPRLRPASHGPLRGIYTSTSAQANFVSLRRQCRSTGGTTKPDPGQDCA